MTRKLVFCCCFVFLSACSSMSDPLIEGELVQLTIECESGETLQIETRETIQDVVLEINNSRREGTQEMEFDVEHQAAFETSEGETLSFNLFSNGKTLMPGNYIHSDIEDFCRE